MMYLEWLLLTQIIMGSLIIVLLHKIGKMKKQIDEIIHEVTAYISYVTEVDKEEVKINREQDASQNQLIQAVLKEYFP